MDEMYDMDAKERERLIIENYQQQEKGMILLFAQWCINNALDPKVLYREAYPNQVKNGILEEVIVDAVSSAEADSIEVTLLLDVLQAYGNDDLAFVVSDYNEKINK